MDNVNLLVIVVLIANFVIMENAKHVPMVVIQMEKKNIVFVVNYLHSQQLIMKVFKRFNINVLVLEMHLKVLMEMHVIVPKTLNLIQINKCVYVKVDIIMMMNIKYVYKLYVMNLVKHVGKTQLYAKFAQIMQFILILLAVYVPIIVL